MKKSYRKLLVLVFILTIQLLSLTAHCKDKSFSFYADDCRVNVVASEVAENFSITLLVSPEVKQKKITGTVSGQNLDEVLNSLCWLLDCEYKKDNNIYYLGGQSDDINVVSSGGLGKELQKAFTDLKVVGDKAVVVGSESEVTRITKAVKDAVARPFLDAYLTVYTYTYDRNRDLTFSIDSNLIGEAVSFSDFVSGSVQPLDFLLDTDGSTI
jgi:hypothetical protein